MNHGLGVIYVESVQVCSYVQREVGLAGNR